jgi:hypothetical protein
MDGTFKAKLWVNEKPIPMNPFVEEFVSRTMVGAVTSLRGVQKIETLEIHQMKGDVEIKVNGGGIPLTPFPNDIISKTLVGMVSSLKDVGDIDSIDISIEIE